MPGSRILVVEDEPLIAFDLCDQLTSLGYDVPDPVADGNHALLAVEALRPDLILMDINIKGDLDGIATAGRIPSSYRIPVIYVTGASDDATVSRAGATAPYGYIVKPFAGREVHAMIQVTLARYQTERALRAALDERWQSRKLHALAHLAGGMADAVNRLLSAIQSQLDPMVNTDPPAARPATDSAARVLNIGFENGRFRHGPAAVSNDEPPVSWHKSDNALFAALRRSGGVRHRLIVEQLPRRNAWDWTVWRPDEAAAEPRHGQAASAMIAMAAAEDAVRQWIE